MKPTKKLLMILIGCAIGAGIGVALTTPTLIYLAGYITGGLVWYMIVYL